MKSNCPKAAWNREKNIQGAGPRNPPTAAPRGRPPATCPAQPNKSFKKPQAGGRVYCLEPGEEETEDHHAVVSGTLLVNHLSTRVLFDAGATYSFINRATAKRLAYKRNEMDMQLCITTPVGSTYQIEAIIKNYPIVIHDIVLPLVVLLEIQGYDMILEWIG